MPTSIKDIARWAGVSHSTVSRALRNSPLIPAKTAERIQKIANEAGYAASAVARSLVLQKTHAIGVVVTSVADPFNGEVVDGIEEVANQHGYSVLLATSQTDPQREVTVVRSFQERRVDGILVASSRVGALYGPILAELKIPIVLTNNQHPGSFVHSVSIDNVDGAYQATRHLIGLGHRRIAYLGDRFGLQSNKERYTGFKKALKQAGLRIPRSFVALGDGKAEGARQAARQLLSEKKRPTAIVCYNDMSALGVLQETAAAGLNVPGDLSLVGFDDIYVTPMLQPPLTTFHQPKKEIGRRSMELLLALLRGEKVEKSVVIKGRLAVRGSTAAPVATSRSLPGRTRPRGLRSTA